MSSRPKWNEDAAYDRELSHAALFGDLETILRRLRAGADVNARDGFGLTPLICAAANGKTAIARVLIEHGADVNAADEHGSTALFYFIARADAEGANLVLDHGADARVDGCDGEPLLLAAVREVHRPGVHDLVLRLLSLGADPHKKNRYGVSASDLANRIDNCSLRGKL